MDFEVDLLCIFDERFSDCWGVILLDHQNISWR
jgi:hypothetical protein